MHDSPPSTPDLEVVDFTMFRRRLAGLIDARDDIDQGFREEQRRKAIDFVACLPRVYGSELDRIKMWDRIATAIQTAARKTSGADCEYFISRVLEHIKASPGDVARSQDINFIMEWLAACPAEARDEWLRYMTAHLYSVLVHARSAWEESKHKNKDFIDA